MPVEYLTPLIEDRAVAVQSALAERGQHRAPSIPDLLIAATAELAELTVLHLDKDFELIAALTGQPQERLNSADHITEGGSRPNEFEGSTSQPRWLLPDPARSISVRRTPKPNTVGHSVVVSVDPSPGSEPVELPTVSCR